MCAFDRGMCVFAQGRCPSVIHRGGGGGVVSSGVRVMLTPRGYAMLPFNQGPGLSCTHMEPLVRARVHGASSVRGRQVLRGLALGELTVRSALPTARGEREGWWLSHRYY